MTTDLDSMKHSVFICLIIFNILETWMYICSKIDDFTQQIGKYSKMKILLFKHAPIHIELLLLNISLNGNSYLLHVLRCDFFYKYWSIESFDRPEKTVKLNCTFKKCPSINSNIRILSIISFDYLSFSSSSARFNVSYGTSSTFPTNKRVYVCIAAMHTMLMRCVSVVKFCSTSNTL